MRALSHALLAVLTATMPVAARGAEVTDAPPQWRGDVHVTYGGSFEQVGLDEAGETYAIRNVTGHDLGIRLEVAVYEGVLVTIGLPISIQQRIAFPAAREMLFEPVDGRGSYVNGQPIDASPIVTGGLVGAWFGVGLVPFSTRYKRSLPFEARFDLAIRTPGRNQTMYGASRGASPGGAALRLAGAFSHRHGVADPYLSFAYVREFPTSGVEVVDNDGNIWTSDLAIKGADSLDVVAGAEIVAKENDKDLRVAIDLHAGFAYRGWEDRASGFWLPSVLDNTHARSRSPAPTTSRCVAA